VAGLGTGAGALVTYTVTLPMVAGFLTSPNGEGEGALLGVVVWGGVLCGAIGGGVAASVLLRVFRVANPILTAVAAELVTVSAMRVEFATSGGGASAPGWIYWAFTLLVVYALVAALPRHRLALLLVAVCGAAGTATLIATGAFV